VSISGCNRNLYLLKKIVRSFLSHHIGNLVGRFGYSLFCTMESSSFYLRFGILTVCFMLLSVQFCVMFDSWIGLVVPIPG
jgi:hypothetical protein